MSRWVDTQTGHRCNVHEVDFDRGESCLACIVGPPDTTPLDGGPEEDHLEKELRLIEAECHRRAKVCWRKAEACFVNNDYGDGCKLSAESAKWTRIAAMEINVRRTQKHELADLIKKYRALLGKDGSN